MSSWKDIEHGPAVAWAQMRLEKTADTSGRTTGNTIWSWWNVPDHNGSTWAGSHVWTSIIIVRMRLYNEIYSRLIILDVLMFYFLHHIECCHRTIEKQRDREKISKHPSSHTDTTPLHWSDLVEEAEVWRRLIGEQLEVFFAARPLHPTPRQQEEME